MLYEITGHSFLGKIVDEIYSYGDYTFLQSINRESSILDVGCGGGHLLKMLSGIGYKNLTGIDPFMEKEYRYKNIRFYKQSIFEHNEDNGYSCVMMNHSFEHMLDSQKVLEKAYRLLKRDGILSIEIPVVNEFLWNRYNIYIDSLDPPFHFILFTPNALKRIAEDCGFEFQYSCAHISPMQEDYYKRNKIKNTSGRTFLQTAYQLIATEHYRRIVNERQDGNIVRFVFRKREK